MRLVILGIFAACAVFLASWIYQGSSLAQDANTQAGIDSDVLGPCEERRYLEYFEISQEVGGLVIGQSPGFEDAAARTALRAAVNKIEFPEAATTFVVAHDPSAKVYTKTCESEPCTLEEVSETETQCLKENLDFCYFVAVRHKDQTYCTLFEG